MKISLIQPGRNNHKYLKWSYNSIRKNQCNHEVEICVADDFSNDGTWNWCQEMMEKIHYLKQLEMKVLLDQDIQFYMILQLMKQPQKIYV